MTVPTIISEEALSLYDVKKELKSIKKRDEQLSVRSARVDEYVNAFTSLSDKDAASAKEEILALDIPRMKVDYVNKILDILPQTADDIKLILTSYSLTVKTENVEKILAILKQYKSK